MTLTLPLFVPEAVLPIPVRFPPLPPLATLAAYLLLIALSRPPLLLALAPRTFLDQIHSMVLGLWGQFAPLLCLVQVTGSSQCWSQEDHGLFSTALRKLQE